MTKSITTAIQKRMAVGAFVDARKKERPPISEDTNENKMPIPKSSRTSRPNSPGCGGRSGRSNSMNRGLNDSPMGGRGQGSYSGNNGDCIYQTS